MDIAWSPFSTNLLKYLSCKSGILNIFHISPETWWELLRQGLFTPQCIDPAAVCIWRYLVILIDQVPFVCPPIPMSSLFPKFPGSHPSVNRAVTSPEWESSAVCMRASHSSVYINTIGSSVLKNSPVSLITLPHLIVSWKRLKDEHLTTGMCEENLFHFKLVF